MKSASVIHYMSCVLLVALFTMCMYAGLDIMRYTDFNNKEYIAGGFFVYGFVTTSFLGYRVYTLRKSHNLITNQIHKRG